MGQKKVAEIGGAIIILIIIGYAIYNVAGQQNLQRFSKTELLLDTVFEVAVFVEDQAEGNRLLRESFSEVRTLERSLSRFIRNSDVDRVNREAGRAPVEVDPATYYVIERSLYFSELSGGKFDITIAPLLELWGFGTGEEKVPSTEEIQGLLGSVDYQKIVLDREGQAVFLPGEDMSIDLGGIAKGYIVDRIVQYLESQGVSRAFVNAGGDIRTLGVRPDGNPWRIGIRDPQQRDNIVAVVPVSDTAIVTSGDYERFIQVDGVRYHHILDPGTGMPAGEVASVSIVAPDCLTADVLSTAVFVLGPREGLELLENIPDAEGVIIDNLKKIHVTSGLEDIIEIR